MGIGKCKQRENAACDADADLPAISRVIMADGMSEHVLKFRSTTQFENLQLQHLQSKQSPKTENQREVGVTQVAPH